MMFLFISFHVFLFLPLVPVFAQNTAKTNQRPPTIRHKPFRFTLNVEDQIIFRASISDDQVLDSVHLFYRTPGEKEYRALKMESIGGTEYLIIIPQRFIFLPGIEYYIQARDAAGNTATQGLENAQIRIKFKALPGEIAGKNGKLNAPPMPTKKSGFRLSTALGSSDKIKNDTPWHKKWWVWSIAIAVIAGVAAASGGGGGGNSSPPPTTGTGTVTGGIP